MDGFTITHLAETPSTSLEAAAAAREGAAEGTAYRGDVQTQGRGRHGRDWYSPKGNLYVSVVLHPRRPHGEWPSLSLVAALALYDAIAGMRDVARLALKWPNDVLFDGMKCAGLLLETVATAESHAVILGCGVNCAAAPAPDSDMRWQAGTLSAHPDDKPVTPDEMLTAFEAAFCRRYDSWQGAGFAAMRDDWLAAAMHAKGDAISLALGGGSIAQGEFNFIDSHGALCLAHADGETAKYHAGEVMRMQFDSEREMHHAVGH